jgi:rhodanese-related sulfurtransferase
MNTQITVSELNERIARGERLQLVDVRASQEYAEGHIPGALHLPMEQAEARMDDLQHDAPVVLVCQSGRRAGMTCELLKSHHDNLLVLTGGTQAWRDASFPIVQTATTRLPLMRQVHIGAGSLILLAGILALTVHIGWIGLALFVGTGLLVSGTTGFCGMAMLLERAPWNRARADKLTAATSQI